ncbi:hypothetical protein HJ057_03245 [Vibrio parahaemolyticus]|uniref:hypothetical protein n=1 Tax=Vibrio parahaemolyticus TaxID=670 RepID=UPI000BE37C69|nr:hypothetical protein [Vibrio parahaemolyticus]ATI44564.1 hypothetical protein CO725_02610 [Vibrio parahaemolyticus]MBE4323964.1 hypothetical protein [Vibrio parahaemolyticus]HCG7132464.1 hypothetical protein [Vibrio parahaemolyticus]HDU8576353.1 hypothetical protein [Vibrio diabolicus]
MSNFAFPAMPTFHGSWQAIYFEPIVGSGERITIAVLAKSITGEYKVVRSMRSEIFECLYGINAPKVVSMVDLTIASISRQLELNKVTDDWVAPIDGVTLGQTHRASAQDINGILRQGLRFSASLSSLALDADRCEDEEVQPKRYTSKFSKTIKEKLEIINPSLVDSFNQKIKISESDALVTYGFMNDRYVTNFGLLVPSRLSASITTIKAKIFDIEALKRSNYLLKPLRYEVIIGTPSFEDPTLTDSAVLNLRNSLEMIEELADKDEIHIYRALDSDNAAHHIVKHAA